MVDAKHTALRVFEYCLVAVVISGVRWLDEATAGTLVAGLAGVSMCMVGVSLFSSRRSGVDFVLAVLPE